ncbi:hypothetical protein F5Y19DRAFT_444620 [Xylariaceae sp. FL1651]|nr:hypothetical protein F5Y19DRAFT_444620 [Xylariaceae sp. FL1651]
MPKQKEFDVATRIQALSWHNEGRSRAEIIAKTGYSQSGLSKLILKAKQRGYCPREEALVRLEYVESGARTGRPPALSQAKKDEIVKILTTERISHKFSTRELTENLNKTKSEGEKPLARRTVLRAIRSEGLPMFRSKARRPNTLTRTINKPTKIIETNTN